MQGIGQVNENKLPQSYRIKRSTSIISIDGKLDEDIWKNCDTIALPYEWSPGDNITPRENTECLVTYDNNNLYVAFRCYDSDPSNIRAHFVERDAVNTFIQDDHISINIDPFNDQRRAFKFCVNALGVQVDGIYSDVDGYEDFSWDAIWSSAGIITEYGYNVEFAIPLNQLRFPNSKEIQTWGFSAQRSLPRNVRHRMCSHIISRDNASITSQFNKITGFENLSPGKNFEIDPTLTAIRFDEVDMEQFPEGSMNKGKFKLDPGITAKWGITPNMVINATLNPDFSQVEADALQLDVNTRYAIYYPEKRPFFMEGAEYFLTPFNAVFSRSVADPVAGIRLTGKTGKSSIGVLAAQDRMNNLLFPSIYGSNSTSIDESLNGAVLRYRYDLGKNSTIGALYTGRVGDQYSNHLSGVDAFFRIDQTNSITFQYLHTLTNYSDTIADTFNQKRGKFGGDGITLTFLHNSRKWALNVQGISITEGFRADYGFIPRVGQRDVSTYAEYHIWGKPESWFNQINIFTIANYITDQDNNLNDRQLGLGITYIGPLQTAIQASLNHTKEFYNQIMYDQVSVNLALITKPISGLNFGFNVQHGDAIDYTNSRLANCFRFGPRVELSLGRHLNIQLIHNFEYLSNNGNKVYTANISQGRIIYNVNTKMNFLANIQYRSVSRNAEQYSIPVEKLSKSIYTQFMFSFKYNPRTMIYMGYSNKSIGNENIDLQKTNQTFFMKLGYALGL